MEKEKLMRVYLAAAELAESAELVDGEMYGYMVSSSSLQALREALEQVK